MAGRIRDTSIEKVREAARIDDVVGQHVALRNAGGGSLKGLCPFHDEKTPSFNVNVSRGFFHCFGCGEGGDVIAFVMKIDALGFAEAVERLAEKYGVPLEYEEGAAPREKRGPARGVLIEAHKEAQAFYAERLASPDALVARQFLAARQFDRDVAADWGLGFAPTDGSSLLKHLRAKGFAAEDLVAAGLARASGHDVFQGRLLWPIRDGSGDVIGFGARKLFDNDRFEGKYINTAETPIYKKNQVLYGLERARKAMKDQGRAVVVEGYTDVMACHLAGVTTAVATCGTSFTSEHGKQIRRYMGDHSATAGEIVFTFDGDAAGQNAALKVFKEDEGFLAQTYVAVAPAGMDPLDLRLKEGDAAVAALIEGRIPLYRFVLRNAVARFDLDRVDGRTSALREAAPLIGSIRDTELRQGYARELAAIVGVDPEEAVTAIRNAGRSTANAVGRRPSGPVPDEPPPPDGDAPAATLPSPRDPRHLLDRELLKLFIQRPVVVGRLTEGIAAEAFSHPAYAAVWRALEAAGGLAQAVSNPTGWAARVMDATQGNAVLTSLVSALAVEPIPPYGQGDAEYASGLVVTFVDRALQRDIAERRSRLQRTDPAAQPDEYRQQFETINALERRRRALTA